MPSQNYMVVHARRDHSLRVPQPPDAATDAPSACAQVGCHAERAAAWITSAYARLFGDRPAHPHWGSLFAAARHGAPEAEAPLAALAGDPARPAIVRASALELLGGYDGETSVAALRTALGDSDPLVRFAGVNFLREADRGRLTDQLAPLLHDPLRAVRMTAAARLAALPGAGAHLGPSYARALDEYVASQRYTSDLPSGPFNLGNLYASQGRQADAERAYRRSLAIDDQGVPAQLNLAMLLAGEGRTTEALAILRALVDAHPDLDVAARDLRLVEELSRDR
jgi:tetratricopeptide (TPR) repeat protein